MMQLKWDPEVNPSVPRYLGLDLLLAVKWALGSLPKVLDWEGPFDRGLVKGLRAARVPGSDDLENALRIHGKIRLIETY